jgi:TPR repeat protein
MKLRRIFIALILAMSCPAMAGTDALSKSQLDWSMDGVQRIYRAATEDANAEAMYLLGVMFDSGRGATQNYEEAFKWYAQAAALGHGEAMNCLGVAHATGRGVPQNNAEALRWFLAAAETGSVDAMSNVAKVYYRGAGVSISYPEAAKWFKRAADQGDPGAMNNLALMYDQGMGVLQDHQSEVMLFEQSADKGYGPAMLNLGILYADGKLVRQDNLNAYAWMGAALRMGLPGDIRESVVYRVAEMAVRLTPDELHRAQRLIDSRCAMDTPRAQQPEALADMFPDSVRYR